MDVFHLLARGTAMTPTAMHSALWILPEPSASRTPILSFSAFTISYFTCICRHLALILSSLWCSTMILVDFPWENKMGTDPSPFESWTLAQVVARLPFGEPAVKSNRIYAISSAAQPSTHSSILNHGNNSLSIIKTQCTVLLYPPPKFGS
jgi:hypothetical protein